MFIIGKNIIFMIPKKCSITPCFIPHVDVPKRIDLIYQALNKEAESHRIGGTNELSAYRKIHSTAKLGFLALHWRDVA